MRFNKKMLTAILFLLMAVVLAGCGEQYIVLDPKGPIGESQKDLIYITMLLCAIIAIPVFIITAVIVWRYRERPGSKAAYKPHWEHNTKLEMVWWGIPIVVIIILAVITINYTYKLEPSKPIASEKEPITIQVTSMDWKWLFNYPEEGIATVNYIKIPEDVPVRFQLTSDTNMNSFWIPQLGGQIYAMSGMAMTLYLQADEQGSYYGSGANFTGKDFAQMTFKTDAVSNEEYEAWIQEVKNSSPPLTDEGYEQLTEPGPSDVQLFSSFPEGLFERIVTQYVEEGSSGAHQHHNGAASGSDTTKKNTEDTEQEQHSDHQAAPPADSTEASQNNHSGH